MIVSVKFKAKYALNRSQSVFEDTYTVSLNIIIISDRSTILFVMKPNCNNVELCNAVLMSGVFRNKQNAMSRTRRVLYFTIICLSDTNNKLQYECM
jgi:hypothetical protein